MAVPRKSSFCRSQGRLSVEMTGESLDALNSVAALYERRTFSGDQNESRTAQPQKLWKALRRPRLFPAF